jgi:hypothetical protein
MEPGGACLIDYLGFSHFNYFSLDRLCLREKRTFNHDNQEHTYNIYDSTGPPSIIFGCTGDVAQDGDTVWYHSGSKWEVASKEVDHVGRPCQKHPLFKSSRRLEGLQWKAQSTWTAKKRKIDDLNGTF